jgi:hypothetical protein
VVHVYSIDRMQAEVSSAAEQGNIRADLAD